MRNGIPLAYSAFRVTWTVVHLCLVALALGAMTVWWFHEGQGMALANAVWASLTAAQQTVANLIPFPWGW